MTDGNIVYQGTALDSPDYFANLGVPIPTYANPADTFMKVLSTSDQKKISHN
jgi:hypothetical protein